MTPSRESRARRTFASERLIEALAPVAATLPPRRFYDASYSDRIMVGSFHVADAANCALSLAARPELPFQPSAAFAARAVAYEALGYINRHGTNALRAFQAVDEETVGDVFPWYWLHAPSTTEGERAATAARAVRLIGSIAKLHELAEARPSEIGLRADWKHPRSPIRLKGRVDLLARTGRAGGDTAIVLVTGTKDQRARAVAAFEALTLTLAGRADLGSVSLLFPDEGRRFAITVDDELLAEGVDATTLAARALAAQRLADPAGIVATPGSYCRYCPLSAPVPGERERGNEGEGAAWCREGADWLAGAGSWPGWRASALDDEDDAGGVGSGA
jgi:hypothetical protein